MSAWLLAALLPAAAGDSQWLAWQGTAHAPHSQQVLYVEQHWLHLIDGQPRERVVLYRCPGGTAFARKHVDYRPSRIAPAFTLDDARSGYREGLSYDAQGAAQVFFRESANAAAQRATLDSATLVADAGFDEFIRLHWEQLVAGESQVFAFAVPAHGSSYRFTLRRVRRGNDGDGTATFRLNLSGLLRWFAPTIEVSYDIRTRQLARFRGLANVRDDQGEQVHAWIDFPEPAQASTVRAAARASALPLAACDGGRVLSSSGQRPPADTQRAADMQ